MAAVDQQSFLAADFLGSDIGVDHVALFLNHDAVHQRKLSVEFQGQSLGKGFHCREFFGLPVDIFGVQDLGAFQIDEP